MLSLITHIAKISTRFLNGIDKKHQNHERKSKQGFAGDPELIENSIGAEERMIVMAECSEKSQFYRKWSKNIPSWQSCRPSKSLRRKDIAGLEILVREKFTAKELLMRDCLHQQAMVRRRER
jgi:hypothetical protein